jgi:hypothetical protein
MLKFFDQYSKVGYKPIPLYQNSKIPVEKNWNSDWSPQRWRPYFERGTYNMGFLLGEILDIEGDTEEGNFFIAKLIGNTPHPMFQSQKSVHHLFINPDPNLTRISHGGIEFRAYKHQSAVPPSIHSDGATYKWLKDSIALPPPMPDTLLKFYHTFKSKYAPRTKRKKDGSKPGHCKTMCNCCSQFFYMHKKRLNLEVLAFRKIGKLWICRRCRGENIKQECKSIRKNILKKSR